MHIGIPDPIGSCHPGGESIQMHCCSWQVVKLLSTLGADVVCADEAEATAYDWAMQGTEGIALCRFRRCIFLEMFFSRANFRATDFRRFCVTPKKVVKSKSYPQWRRNIQLEDL